MFIYVELAAAFLCLVIPLLFDKQIAGLLGWGGFSVCVVAALWQYGKNHGWVRAQKYTRCGILVAVLIIATFFIPFNRLEGPAAVPQATASQLVMESIIESPTIVPQGNQRCSARVAKLARLKVKNIGGVRITNVGIVVLRTNDFVGPFQPQLPVSSMGILFDCPDTPLIQVSVDLSPGDDVFFGAVIECKGTKECPKGKLGIPYVSNGAVSFLFPVIENIERLDEFTVRASGDRATAATKTFHVSKSPDGGITLNGGEENRDILPF